MTTLDPLSDVLRSVRLRGSVFFHVSCRGQWAAQAAPSRELAPAVMPGAEHVIEYHLFVKGEGWVAVDGEPPLRVSEGGIVMLPHGDAHVVSSAPGMRPWPEDNWLFRMLDDPKPIPVTYHGNMVEPGSRLPIDDASTVIVCGFIACDLRPFNPLIDALPKLLHLPAEGVGAWVAPMLEHAVSESAARRAGSAALLERVSEMVFVDSARRYFDSLPPQSQGWLGALRDRQVGRAIALMHAEPAEAWTLEDLGHRAGLSRSALHERFVALTGLAPMQYLARWRMQCGARLLRESHANVAAVALEVGYDSEAAFARAFKRATGSPPAAWRRAQRQSAGSQ
ncbi:AraC family transcriptional regulator [Rhizobacter sp. Root1221]|uniref:AraC family transcriptional regulator n=1 Tax=Rhizobacter sp. Root1221 TaxID=1736433 RepID=UPI0006F5E389|nr:AraC family transcriptional regulator [Rhizobacter sp. Root1221]KQV84567.1 AraC family transcriptional regulator [Rhizobacter sp. Root1221]